MVKCLVCGKEMNYINNFHLKKHGLTEYSYLKMYPGTPICSEEVQKNKRECHNGQIAWNIGLTAKTNESVKRSTEKAEITKKQRRELGLYDAPWNKHLTKETDKSGRLMEMSIQISKTLTGRKQSIDLREKRRILCKRGVDSPCWKPELHKINLCACGCGDLTKPGKTFISGHNSRTVDYSKRIMGNANPASFAKQKRTMVEKYGVAFPFKSIEIKERTRQTNLKRYGIENPGILAVGKKDTSIEILLAEGLKKSISLPYKKHIKIVCCYPDVVFEEYKVAVFCDGDYWHGNMNLFPKLTQRQELQKKKDYVHTKKLEEDGWKVFRFWETEIENTLQECIERIKETLDKYKEEYKNANDLERVNKIALQGYIGETPEMDNTEGSFERNPVETTRLVPIL